MQNNINIIDNIIILAICGLFFSIPIQCQRNESRDICRTIEASKRADSAIEFALMAKCPAAWMDEFRQDFNQLADLNRTQSEKFKEAIDFDSAHAQEEKEFREAGYDQTRLELLWNKFRTAAKKNQYVRPRIGPSYYKGGGMIRGLIPCWSTALSISILIYVILNRRTHPMNRIWRRSSGRA